MLISRIRPTKMAKQEFTPCTFEFEEKTEEKLSLTYRVYEQGRILDKYGTQLCSLRIEDSRRPHSCCWGFNLLHGIGSVPHKITEETEDYPGLMLDLNSFELKADDVGKDVSVTFKTDRDAYFTIKGETTGEGCDDQRVTVTWLDFSDKTKEPVEHCQEFII